MRPSRPLPARPAALLLLLGLATATAACTQDEVKSAIGGSMRSWCANTPQHCSSADAPVH